MRLSEADLAPAADLALARRLLAAWSPPSEAQGRTRDAMLRFVEEHPRDAHLRSCVAGHLTASALLLDAGGARALLTYHRKLGRWLQLGGHCDGDANLPGVALREAREESGLAGLAIDPVPIDLDVHEIPARPGEPAHLHLDTRFLVWAPPGAVAAASGESIRLGWFTAAETVGLGLDDSVRRLFEIALGARR